MSFDPNSNNPYTPTFGDSSSSAPPKKPVRWGCILSSIAAVAVVGVALCCGVGYFGWTKAANIAGEQVSSKLRQKPEVTEKMGELTNTSLDLMGTAKNERNQNPDPNSNTQIFVFQVQGTKQSGTLYIEVSKGPGADPSNLQNAELRLDNGDKIIIGNGLSKRAEAP